MLGNLPTFELAGLSIGLRELVLALIVLVALYIGVVLWRMRRLHATAARPGAAPAESRQSAAAAVPVEPLLPDPAESIAPPPDEDDRVPAQEMAESLLYAGMERELALLREEVDIMRGELAALREDMQHELAHLRATQTVSPIYGDAMQMATTGYDAGMIAERCGIARAEAELVVALARSQVK